MADCKIDIFSRALIINGGLDNCSPDRLKETDIITDGEGMVIGDGQNESDRKLFDLFKETAFANFEAEDVLLGKGKQIVDLLSYTGLLD